MLPCSKRQLREIGVVGTVSDRAAMSRSLISASCGVRAVRAGRRSPAMGWSRRVEAVNHPSVAFDELMASEDATEGMTAFAAKRRPRWRNR